MSNIPNLRFKGFGEPWEQCKLENVIEEVIDNRGKNPPYYCEEGIPIIDNYMIKNSGYPDLSKANRYIDDYLYENFIRKYNKVDDILITLVGNGIGNIALFPSEKAVIVQNTLGLRVLEDKLFMYYELLFKNSEIVKLDRGMAQPSIRQDELKNIEILIPNMREQSRIGLFLKELDNLITLHQRKCYEMKELKKYMLQKLFPKKDSNIPEIRFKGFTEAWEQRKFGECYKMSSGYAFKQSDYCEVGIPIINGESIQHGTISSVNLNYLPMSFSEKYLSFILKTNDIVVGLNRPITNGKLKIAQIPFKFNNSLLYQRAGKISYLKNIDKYFTYILLSQEILKHTKKESVGSDQPFISTVKLDRWKMMIPNEYKEQHEIGDFFKQLDNLITLHQHKYEELKEIKKYMLSNIFPK